MRKNKNGLTPRQQIYCQERAKGKTQKESYKAAGYCKGGTDKTRREKASRLERLPAIQAELERLTEQAESGAVLGRQQRMAMLSEMALDTTMKDDNRQRAIDMLNRMNGDYTDRQVTEVAASIDLSYDEKRKAVLEALRDN